MDVDWTNSWWIPCGGSCTLSDADHVPNSNMHIWINIDGTQDHFDSGI